MITHYLDSEDYGDVIEIIVGSKETKFVAHKYMVCAKSAFFMAACDKRWGSGRTCRVMLEEQSPEIFAIFMSWLISGELHEAATFIDLPDVATGEKVPATTFNARWNQLARCFILGDFLQAAEFKNTVVDALLEDQKRYSKDYNKLGGTAAREIILVWANTTKDAPIRRIVLDMAASQIDNLRYLEDEATDAAMQEYLFELASRLIGHRWGRFTAQCPWLKDVCSSYHQHPGMPEGYSCTKK